MFDLSHGMTCDSICLHDIMIIRGTVLGVLFGVAGTIASSFESPAAFAPPARVRSAEGFCPPCAIMARPNPVVGGAFNRVQSPSRARLGAHLAFGGFCFSNMSMLFYCCSLVT